MRVKLKSCSQALAAMKKSIVIKPCSRKYISDVILSSTERAQLFPEDIIFFNWVPFEPLWSNIDHILEDCNELFTEDFVDDSIPRSISFGTYLPTEKFLDWRTAIYLDDLTLFEAHLLHQLNRACEFIKSDFFLFVFMTRGGQNSRKSDWGTTTVERLSSLFRTREDVSLWEGIYEIRYIWS